MIHWALAKLPLNIDLGTEKVLKALITAHAALAELKGISSTIPNQNILINTLGLQEARDSSAIENIITTHDDLYKSALNLEAFIKMAIIHFQFESIHPFYDGNGRTGRIINILYLILQNLQTLPILYLSHYIIKHKPDYYRYLQKVREENLWEDWILFMIKGVEETSRETIDLIIKIRELMLDYKHRLRVNYKFYSQDLLNNLFKHPYTKIEFVVNDLGVSRLTAANYLNKLAEDKMLRKEKLGTGNYYINEKLFDLLTNR